MSTVSSAADALRNILRDDQVLTEAEDLERYSHDDAEWAYYALPLAVVLPESNEDVSRVVKLAAKAGIHVIARGAGTGLSGGANATALSVILSVERMTTVIEINVAERYVVAQAGVINNELREAVADEGLWYPPDPASYKISTIGGNAATNAGGLCCVKYGVTRDYVLGMTVVLADGEIVTLGHRTAKGVTGYDLAGLMIGSEGTLGIITELTLRLLPLSGREQRAVIGYFPSLQSAGVAVAAVTAAGIIPSALELIDGMCLKAVDDWKELGLPEGADTLLLATVDELGATGEELADRLAGIFADAGSLDVQRGADAEIDDLFLARRLAYPALERLGPVLTEDVCVPRAAVPEMLGRIQATAQEHNVVIANIAHAGDGNLHPLIIAPEGDDEVKSRAKLAFNTIIQDCIDLGGTVTGEHGVGLLKLDGARSELGPRVLDLHHAIKDALDPRGILNPGKGF